MRLPREKIGLRDSARRHKILIAVFVLLAVAAIPVAVIAQSPIWRMGPDPFPVLQDYFETFPTPDGLILVKEERTGEGDPFFGEHAQLVRYYEAIQDPDEMCGALRSSFEEWGVETFEYRAAAVTSPEATCEMFAAKKAPSGIGGDGGVAVRGFVYELDVSFSQLPRPSEATRSIVRIDLTD